jgi:alkaline phosphatase D
MCGTVPSILRLLCRCAPLTGCALTVLSCADHAPPAPAPSNADSGITHGVAVGEVTATSAIVWARCRRISPLQVAIGSANGATEITLAAPATADRDWTARVPIDNLKPDTSYRYRAWCGGSAAPADVRRGAFRTAPDPRANAGLRFVWGGDLGGQNACRDREEGYAVFDVMAAQHPDFFVALGDMIYADDACRATGRYGNPQIPGPAPAQDLPAFWAQWKYNRSDAAQQRFLAATPYYAVWDDHEVMNDFGPYHDVWPGGTRHLLPIGLAAFVDYNPIAGHGETPRRLYRRARWGQRLELLFLDTRQYRDPNFAPDEPERPKTMLGIEQRTWLEDALRASDATWKIVVTSVPLAYPTGMPEHGRDGWAGFDQPTGFQRELLGILRFIAANGIRNTLWISTDVHFAAVFRHTPFPDTPTFQFYEIETGPLTAGVFPTAVYDRTLGTERLFLYPATAHNTGAYAQARSWFNFGVIDIDASGQLKLTIVNADGAALYTLSLEPQA